MAKQGKGEGRQRTRPPRFSARTGDSSAILSDRWRPNIRIRPMQFVANSHVRAVEKSEKLELSDKMGENDVISRKISYR